MKKRVPSFLMRLPALVRFVPVYLWEMTLSNLRIAADALRIEPRFDPGFVEVSVRGYGEAQWWRAACLISMTPGTLTVDLDEQSQMLVVHSLYLQDPDATRQSLEKLLRQALGTPNMEPA
jgi:multicomponent Na+:H+ antiporter subunit E